MKKSITYFVGGVFCFAVVYGCLWLLGFLLEKSLENAFSGKSISITANAVSPDNKYIATTYTDVGGGAAGWCHVIVNLRRQDEPFDEKDKSVFLTRCNSEVETTWQNDKTLLITYTTDYESASLFQRTQSLDKIVKIDYLEQKTTD